MFVVVEDLVGYELGAAVTGIIIDPVWEMLSMEQSASLLELMLVIEF